MRLEENKGRGARRQCAISEFVRNLSVQLAFPLTITVICALSWPSFSIYIYSKESFQHEKKRSQSPLPLQVRNGQRRGRSETLLNPGLGPGSPFNPGINQPCGPDLSASQPAEDLVDSIDNPDPYGGHPRNIVGWTEKNICERPETMPTQPFLPSTSNRGQGTDSRNFVILPALC